MKIHALLLGLVVLAGCDATGADPSSVEGDLLPDDKSDGFFFQRRIPTDDHITPRFQVDGNFDPSSYAAYRFEMEQVHEVDLLSWTDFHLGDATGLGIDRAISHALFKWAPRWETRDDPSDGGNWMLVRLDRAARWSDGTCFTCPGAWQRTRAVLNEGDYMLVLLTGADVYAQRGEFHLSMSLPTGGDTQPGSLTVGVRYGGGAPVAGLRVSVGSVVATTWPDGGVFFPSLPPGVYTMKLGSDGYEHVETVVRAGAGRTQQVLLDHPLP